MHKKILMEKMKEAAASVLPVTVIVLAVCLLLVPVESGLMLAFLIGSAMLIAGIGLFSLGAEMSMTRIGSLIGAKMTKSRKLGVILLVSFLLGAAITVAEPDLQVLATNVPNIDKTVLILTVSVGVGLFLMLCMVRILFSISLKWLLLGFYILIFVGAFVIDRDMLSIAFDSGGVTTGPMTVPFIMALGVGVASIRSDENAKADSFGLVALCSIGPVLAVMLLGAIYPTDTQADVSMIIGGFETSVDLGFAYLHSLPDYLLEVAMALLPIFVFFLLSGVGGSASKWIALVIFAAASITDTLDGYIARRDNLITDFGKFMDPLADKLLVCSALICFVELDKLPAWMVIIIIAREFIISGFRLVASDNGIVIAASWWGKSKTISQMIMIILLIADIPALSVLNTVLIWVALILTVVSLIDYLVKNKNVLSMQN